jgi:hypothetical protein
MLAISDVGHIAHVEQPVVAKEQEIHCLCLCYAPWRLALNKRVST